MLEAAAGVLQLASAEADNMAALTIDELLQSWGRGTIRKRFHELSMQVHPDKCSLPMADQVSISPVSCSLRDQSDRMANPVDLCPQKNSPLLEGRALQERSTTLLHAQSSSEAKRCICACARKHTQEPRKGLYTSAKHVHWCRHLRC